MANLVNSLFGKDMRVGGSIHPRYSLGRVLVEVKNGSGENCYLALTPINAKVFAAELIKAAKEGE